MIKIRFFILALATCFVGSGCGKKTNRPDGNMSGKPKLILPAKDEVCTTGQVISDAVSRVTFKWTAVPNATSYLIRVTNLYNGDKLDREVENSELELSLERGRPYSWSVVSKSAKDGSSVQSEEVWRFYNAAPGKISYAPFPAEILSPLWGRSVNLSEYGSVKLLWKGIDVDGDIIGYDLYFGTEANPPLYQSNMNASEIDIALSRYKMYYWKVLSKDATGNISDSGVYQFSTL